MSNLYAVVYSDGEGQKQIFVMAPSFGEAVIKVQLSKKTEGSEVNSLQLVAPADQILQ